MARKTYSAFRRAEEQWMEAVYQQLESECSAAWRAEKDSVQYVESGRYEAQDSFTAYSDHSNAVKKKTEADQLYEMLYQRPYFAHIETQLDENMDEGDTRHYFLSDCEFLDHAVNIDGQQESGLLLPFKKDAERPVFEALQTCYYNRNGKRLHYTVERENEPKHKESIQPVLICDDEIANRDLVSAVQLFPEADFVPTTADELLELKLDENRNNPKLKNIIATLQRRQYEIIEIDLAESFVVQGCAGSGKSQCLLHRLFFLRDELSQDGWEHVLLLTPNLLFRKYSEDLRCRYQLADIENCSIAELYKDFLSKYDPHFQNRQYRLELSEEYLPDEYLRAVYAEETIHRIDEEIDAAIYKHVASACAVLGVQMIHPINADTIAELTHQVPDASYLEKWRKYNQIQKDLSSAQKNLEKIQAKQETNDQKLRDLAPYMELLREVEQESDPELRKAWTADLKKEMRAFTKNRNPETYFSQLQEKQGDFLAQEQTIRQEIAAGEKSLKEYETWIRERLGIIKGDLPSVQGDSSDWLRVQSSLSRIERIVFEQAVWNVLLPYKEQNHVEVFSSPTGDGEHQKKTKILYKSDLLFYLKIYVRLRAPRNLPNYNLICVDEGQDLQKADYDMLHTLFPDAALNVFGDTAQVLHTACGVRDWQSETGISTVYALNRNYRNTAEIVDFCNTRFGSAMQWIGKIQQEHYPVVLEDAADLYRAAMCEEMVIIVKDQNCFELFLQEIGAKPDAFEFLDTNANAEVPQKGGCYSIFAAKGLEFSEVVVYAKNMTTNQKMVACTRATRKLYYYD